jgi:hypothetical protein
MSNLSNLATSLSSQEVIAGAGFAAGLFWGSTVIETPKNLLKYPLSSILKGAGYGSLTALGASYVSKNLPERARFIVPVALAASLVYYAVVAGKDIYYGKKNDDKWDD